MPPTTGRRYGSKTAEERRAERRARLMAAALDAFGTDGYGAASIEQLCAAAGISTRNFYEEFRTREALLIALHDDVNARALAAVGAALAGLDQADLEARARAGVRAYFDVMTSDRRWARIALVESVGISAEAEAHRRAAIDGFAALLSGELARLADAGAITHRDRELTVVALVGAINGLVNTWTVTEDWDARVDDVVETAARLVVLAARG